MRKAIYYNWNVIMDADHNPLRHIPDVNTRHLILQTLAWMWCIIFSSFVGSWYFFGLSAIAHSLLLAGIAITVGTFESTASKYDVKRRL
tara:strand:+ start:343 stop:609 length:267 start_codon:yes stop_codon:yes gene_type:complete